MASKRIILEQEQARRLLAKADYGVLSLIDVQDMPYGVPIHYVYDEKKHALAFHCGKDGRKIRAMQAHPQVALTAVVQETIVAPYFITHYQSVMAQGEARIVTEEEEKREWLLALCRRFAPQEQARWEEVIAAYWQAVCMVRVDITELSGKESRDDEEKSNERTR